MYLKYYMDQHVPRSITVGLRQKGVDILTAYEDEGSELEDEDLLERAKNLNRVLFTQDKDFLSIAAEYQRTERLFSGIIFTQQKSITIGVCIENLELIAKVLKPKDMLNQIIFLPI